jgi:hypothetical protein
MAAWAVGEVLGIRTAQNKNQFRLAIEARANTIEHSGADAKTGRGIASSSCLAFAFWRSGLLVVPIVGEHLLISLPRAPHGATRERRRSGSRRRALQPRPLHRWRGRLPTMSTILTVVANSSFRSDRNSLFRQRFKLGVRDLLATAPRVDDRRSQVKRGTLKGSRKLGGFLLAGALVVGLSAASAWADTIGNSMH